MTTEVLKSAGSASRKRDKPHYQEWLGEILAPVPFHLKVNFMGQEIVDNYPYSVLPAALTLNFKHPGVIKDLFLNRDPLILVEAYVKGLLDIDGDLEWFFSLGRAIEQINLRELPLPALLEIAMLPGVNLRNNHEYSQKILFGRNQSEDKSAIQHHYDLGNEFYRLWLDKELVYSCAHFATQAQSLDKAQEAKLDLICKKLLLRPGETLLDVGCGWGALIRWAAKYYGVKAHGITLSQKQFDYNRDLIRKGIAPKNVTVDLLDYRALSTRTKFDKIVSVGMIEHVGVKNYRSYFTQLMNALAPDGLLLNHGIVTNNKWNNSGSAERFINQYIFPNGELSRFSTISSTMENCGWEIIDVDAWRPHYALTLRHWYKNLRLNYKYAAALVGMEKAKLWAIYLLGSALAFEQNNLGVYQVLARRRIDSTWTQPISRAGWLI